VTRLILWVSTLQLVGAASVWAQAPAAPATQHPQPAPAGIAESRPTPANVPTGVPLPAGYKIGPDDVLAVMFWRDKDMTNEVTVRPDGRITLPLLNDVVAAGMTPDELRAKLTTEAQRYLEDPNVTVVVKQINSRKVFITGLVGKPGAYPLMSNTTVVQLISMAGGLADFANAKKIRVLRTQNGKQESLPFNYREVANGENLDQNIELKPGDTVVVP
jgi:polysaccharide biosynthesis/export protein